MKIIGKVGFGMFTGSVMFLAGCQATQNAYQPHTELYPPQGQTSSVEIGESVIERTRGIGSPSIQLSDVVFELNGYEFFLPGSQYEVSHREQNGVELSHYGYEGLRSRSQDYFVSGSAYNVAFDPSSGECSLRITNLNLADGQGNYISNWKEVNSQKVENDSVKTSVIPSAIWQRNSGMIEIGVPNTQCKQRYKFSSIAHTFRQELIYLGRSADILSFKYREFSGSLARPAFSADLTYDLSESRVIGYRGARLEILDAGNQEIKYRVVRHMEGI